MSTLPPPPGSASDAGWAAPPAWGTVPGPAPSPSFGATPPGDAAPAVRVPRFPWISLVLLVLAPIGVVVGIGLAIAGAVQTQQDQIDALARAADVASYQSSTTVVSGSGDTLHIWAVLPEDAAAWRSDGSLAMPSVSSLFVATQQGSGLDVESVVADQYSADQQALEDGSTAIQIANVHPEAAGSVEIRTSALAPATSLRVVRDPSGAHERGLFIAAAIVGPVSALVFLGALVTFIVMLVRRSRAKPKPPRRQGGYPIPATSWAPGSYPAVSYPPPGTYPAPGWYPAPPRLPSSDPGHDPYSS